MRAHRVLTAVLASLVMSGFCAAGTLEEMGDIYKHRCANCHGVKADGVPKLKERHGVKPEEAAEHGVASQEKGDIHGPPLNTMTQEELLAKLKDLRNKDFDSKSYHSVMQKNLEHVEAREGDIADGKMAEYIYTTFGAGAD